MRGFWVDERVDGQIWLKDSNLYKIGKKFEKLFLKHANAIILLSSAAIIQLKKIVILGTNEIIVIPTCTDLHKFYPKKINKNKISDSIVLGYVGSVTGWYLFDPVLEFYKHLSGKKLVRFIILNQGEHDFIKNKFSIKKVSMDNVELKSVLHDDVPYEMQKMNLGIFFIKPSYSKIASCATKLGEFLSCGIPCITNHGIGDHTEILYKSNTGVIINDLNQFDYSKSVDKTITLLNDPDTPIRCRNVAEDYFSLQNGVALFSKLYNTLI
jgi:glycosyltransferase involved in cell wall biosynthesis